MTWHFKFNSQGSRTCGMMRQTKVLNSNRLQLRRLVRSALEHTADVIMVLMLNDVRSKCLAVGHSGCHQMVLWSFGIFLKLWSFGDLLLLCRID